MKVKTKTKRPLRDMPSAKLTYFLAYITSTRGKYFFRLPQNIGEALDQLTEIALDESRSRVNRLEPMDSDDL